MTRPTDRMARRLSKDTAAQRATAPFVILFTTLSAMFALGQLNRSAGGVISPVLAEELSLGASRLSIVIGAPLLAQGLMQLPAGILLDRYGPRRTIPALAALGAIGLFVFALSADWLGLVAGRALIGVGFAAVMSGTYVLFTRWVPPHQFSTVSGRFLFIGGAGGLMATTPLAVAIDLVGWRTTFFWMGVVTLAICVLTVTLVRDTPPGEEKAPASSSESLWQVAAGLGAVLRNRAIWPMLLVGLCIYTPPQILLGLWAGPFLQDIYDLPAIERSHILLAMALCTNTGALIMGPLERRFDARRRVILTIMGLIALLFAVLAAFAYTSLWQTVAVFIGVSLISPFYIVVMSHAQAMFPRASAGRALTAVNMCASGGVFFVQNLTGLAIEAVPHASGTGSLDGYRLVFASMAAIFALATLIYTRMPEIRPSEPRKTDGVSP
jgi:MFS family permease